MVSHYQCCDVHVNTLKPRVMLEFKVRSRYQMRCEYSETTSKSWIWGPIEISNEDHKSSIEDHITNISTGFWVFAWTSNVDNEKPRIIIQIIDRNLCKLINMNWDVFPTFTRILCFFSGYFISSGLISIICSIIRGFSLSTLWRSCEYSETTSNSWI